MNSERFAETYRLVPYLLETENMNGIIKHKEAHVSNYYNILIPLYCYSGKGIYILTYLVPLQPLIRPGITRPPHYGKTTDL
jgi:hypothetical protein